MISHSNLPEHISAIFPWAFVRNLLPSTPTHKPNTTDVKSLGSTPILIAPDTPNFGSSSPKVVGSSKTASEGCNPPCSLAGFFSSDEQDNFLREKTNLFPLISVFISSAAADVFRQLISSFLHACARVDLDGNHAGKGLGHVTKDDGEIPNGRVEFRVSDDERAHSAARGSSKQDGTYSSRSPKIEVEVLAGVFGLVCRSARVDQTR